MSDLSWRELEREALTGDPIAAARLKRMRERMGLATKPVSPFEDDELALIIDGEKVTVEDVHEYGYLPVVDTDDGAEYYLAESSAAAGEIARDYWREMAENDPSEFRCMVGDDTLIAWALGQYAGPGTRQVSSLDEWLDLWLDTPEEQWSSYDGEETEIEAASPALIEALGFTPTVAYRHN
jgi:hypothetical protein